MCILNEQANKQTEVAAAAPAAAAAAITQCENRNRHAASLSFSTHTIRWQMDCVYVPHIPLYYGK